MKKLLFFFLFITLMACGGSGPSDNSGSSNGNPPNNNNNNNDPQDDNPIPVDTSSFGEKVELSFNFLLQTQSPTDGSGNMNILSEDRFTLPLYIKPSGDITVLARDFPKMVSHFQVCPEDSNLDDEACDARTSAIPINNILSIDIVLDSCGLGVLDRNCGDRDVTLYHGKLLANGIMSIENIAIRARAFGVSGAKNGHNAMPYEEGLLPVERIVVRRLTTEMARAGGLTVIGSAVNDVDVKLVTAGQIPRSIPTMGGIYYAAVLTRAVFDAPPLDLLE